VLENLQEYFTVQAVLSRCFARIELLYHWQYSFLCKFCIVECVKRFFYLVSGVFVMCAVAALAVIGDEILHHVFHCAYYVRRVGSVLVLDS
jgi:hypothetical protein